MGICKMKREEALEQIRKWDFLNEEEIEAIHTLIPELKESEDERVRKELLAVINDLVLPDEQKARFNAWLEKQEIFSKGEGLYYYRPDGNCTFMGTGLWAN